MYKKIRSHWIKHFDFIIIDLVCIQFVFLLSYFLRYGFSSIRVDPIYIRVGILIFLLHIFIVFFSEFYSGILRRGYLKEFKAVVKHNCILLAMILAFLFAEKQSSDYSRALFFIFWGLNCVFMYAAHILTKLYIKEQAKDETNSEYLLLITTKALAKKMVAKLLRSKYSTYKLKGIVIVDADMANQKMLGIPVIADFDTMFEFARTHIVDEVLLNIPHSGIEEITNQFLEMGITVHINIDRISSELPNRTVEEINGFTVVTTTINMVTVRQLVLKRLMDILGGLVGLLATGIAFVFFAPVIYIQSPGPIFFSQVRMGRNGRRFKIYKFRSMYMDAEERKKELMAQNKMNGLMFKMDNDPRVIPIGQFMRKTSIDEFPQFFNVLKGDMSLVGTRPPTVDEYEQYDFHHKSRLAAKPGLTGMWQVSGRSDITDFEEIVALDTQYIKNWSLGLDLKILFKTVAVVVARKGSA